MGGFYVPVGRPATREPPMFMTPTRRTYVDKLDVDAGCEIGPVFTPSRSIVNQGSDTFRTSFSLAFSTSVARLLLHSSGAGLFQHARRCAVMQREVQPWHSRRRVHSTCAAAEC